MDTKFGNLMKSDAIINESKIRAVISGISSSVISKEHKILKIIYDKNQMKILLIHYIRILFRYLDIDQIL
jgi:hypothetical protein